MIDDTLTQRAATHGSFSENSEIAQQLKDTIRHTEGWYRLLPTQREALDMIFHKIARIMAGNSHFADHWHDIQGYARLCEEEILAANPVDRK